jgi:hypothetical protein
LIVPDRFAACYNSFTLQQRNNMTVRIDVWSDFV